MFLGELTENVTLASATTTTAAGTGAGVGAGAGATTTIGAGTTTAAGGVVILWQRPNFKAIPALKVVTFHVSIVRGSCHQ